MNTPWSKVIEGLASSICQHYELSKNAQTLLTERQNPQQFLATLLVQKQYDDAVTFMTHALPKRQAIWWACLCCRDAQKISGLASPDYESCLKHAETWVVSPSDEQRRETGMCAESAGFDQAASWAAIAAFWSEGSIAKPEEPALSAPPYLYAEAASGAISLSAILVDKEHPEAFTVKCISRAVDLAQGGKGVVTALDSLLEAAKLQTTPSS